MSRPLGGPVDVEAVRRAHPIHEVVAASGIDLVPRGHGFVACCPFHHDDTPSMSVNGVPERFHCFGCGASGDVIDFVQRRYGMGFREAVERLEGADLSCDLQRELTAFQRSPRRPTISRDRAYQVNAMAWEVFADPVGTRFAQSYLQHHRGIDVATLEPADHGPLAGRAGSGWTHLVDVLRLRGVTANELIAVDLAQASRHGHLIDTLRDRVVLPVRAPDGRISGFIGRDITGDPRAPKYRNPTRTPVFDKAVSLYRPTLTPPAPQAVVVVVEGPIDALAVAATAASAGLTDRLIPVSGSGTAVSAAQAAQVCALAPGKIILALDGDDAGHLGTQRWLNALTLQRHRIAHLAELPRGMDPAQWVTERGIPSLATFGLGAADDSMTPPRLPGRELVQVCLSGARDPVRDIAHQLLTVARLTAGSDTVELLNQAQDEMTRQGWNPRGVFGHYLRNHAVQELHDQLIAAQRHPSATRSGPLLLAP